METYAYDTIENEDELYIPDDHIFEILSSPYVMNSDLISFSQINKQWKYVVNEFLKIQNGRKYGFVEEVPYNNYVPLLRLPFDDHQKILELMYNNHVIDNYVHKLAMYYDKDIGYFAYKIIENDYPEHLYSFDEFITDFFLYVNFLIIILYNAYKEEKHKRTILNDMRGDPYYWMDFKNSNFWIFFIAFDRSRRHHLQEIFRGVYKTRLQSESLMRLLYFYISNILGDFDTSINYKHTYITSGELLLDKNKLYERLDLLKIPYDFFGSIGVAL